MSQPPNGIAIGSAVFAQLTREPNTHTYRQTMLRATSLAIGRISCTVCRQCGLIMVILTSVQSILAKSRIADLSFFAAALDHKAIDYSELRPRCRHLANSTKQCRLVDSAPLARLHENMRLSMKVEIHNVLHSRRRRAKSRPHVQKSW